MTMDELEPDWKLEQGEMKAIDRKNKGQVPADHIRQAGLEMQIAGVPAHELEVALIDSDLSEDQLFIHTSFFIIKKDISLCYGLGMDMVHQDFPFQSIREKEFKREIKGMASLFFVTSRR